MMSPLPRIDWFRVLTDLDRRGYTLGIVGATLSIPYSTLYAWRAGGEPRHQEGEAIVGLWARVTQRHGADVPRLLDRESMSAARARR